METIQNNPLSNQEKTLIAMGAAMGAGCRTCSDKLYDIAISLNIPKDEMLKAFLLGLDAKKKAVETMQRKVSALMNGNTDSAKEFSPKLISLINMASFTAANSAPDCLAEIKQAMPGEITDEQIQICLATAKMVRKNAIGLSDQEISNKLINAESDIQGTCCPASPNSKNASACSCS